MSSCLKGTKTNHWKGSKRSPVEEHEHPFGKINEQHSTTSEELIPESTEEQFSEKENEEESKGSFARKTLNISYENIKGKVKIGLRHTFFDLRLDNNKKVHCPFIGASQCLTQSPDFNISLPTVIIFHGHLECSDCKDGLGRTTALAIQNLGNSNVLTYDHNAVTFENYFYSSLAIQIIGKSLARVIAQMRSKGVGYIHMIGLSLSAHLCGFIGKEFFKLTGEKIDRITGLEPAGPCFFKEPQERKLTKTDAKFVDAIRTNVGWYGITDPVGHLDFFPNNGTFMPGCYLFPCHHAMSVFYYIESVKRRNAFKSVKCQSWSAFKNRDCSNDSKASMGHWLKSNAKPGPLGRIPFKISHDNIEGKVNQKIQHTFFDLRLDNEKTVRCPFNGASQCLTELPEFDLTLPTVIVIHGYIEDSTSNNSLGRALALEIQTLGNSNVLTYDHNIVTIENYLYSTVAVQIMAKSLARVIADMRSSGVGYIHMIGLSLGAHLCGFVGKEFFTMTGEKIDRITGLDPAGPCFFREPVEMQLTKTDAILVDAIRTSVGVLGVTIPVGHVDFFPNNGTEMPGCHMMSCHHAMAVRYYMESVKNRKAFLSVKCDSWGAFKNKKCTTNAKALLGHWLKKTTKPGKYYLQTLAEAPYGLGKAGIL
ncbi:uncharacterized protein LOC143917357 [Arctopsyche grandis]|uniref:uncharacterized protein LOC143917357 n=1 Tax=Arctopsyche grandis TaxID=121162 RepID=UPI00406DA25B